MFLTCCLLVFFFVWTISSQNSGYSDRIELMCHRNTGKAFFSLTWISCQCVIYWPLPSTLIYAIVKHLRLSFLSSIPILTHLCLCRFCFLEWHFPNWFPFLFSPGKITVIFQGPVQNHLLILPSLSTVSYLFFLLMVLLTVRTHFKIFFFLTNNHIVSWERFEVSQGLCFYVAFPLQQYVSPLRLR